MEKFIDELGLSTSAKSLGLPFRWGRRVVKSHAYCASTPFILLDEPFSGIDPIAVPDLQKSMAACEWRHRGGDYRSQRARNTFGKPFSRIFRQGKPEQLAGDPEVRRVYLGESFSLV
jgi:lipopolysaccharide export system ATP-binding protein